MQPEAFVTVVRQVVEQAAITDVMSQLERPSGRRPSASRVELSAWFAGLTDQDRLRVQAIIADAAHAAVFGMLCALDGSRTILDPDGDGRIELIFRSAAHEKVIATTDGRGSALHELL
jgi:hypothetical protein